MMKWLRINYSEYTPLRDGHICYYASAVRSDGKLFKWGVDIPSSQSITVDGLQKTLRDGIDYYLDCDYIFPKSVGEDAHKGEAGWIEL